MMNNYERIKQMSIEEMAEFFSRSDCDVCIYNPETSECDCCSDNLECYDGIKQWLESEVEQ